MIWVTSGRVPAWGLALPGGPLRQLGSTSDCTTPLRSPTLH